MKKQVLTLEEIKLLLEEICENTDYDENFNEKIENTDISEMSFDEEAK